MIFHNRFRVSIPNTFWLNAENQTFDYNSKKKNNKKKTQTKPKKNKNNDSNNEKKPMSLLFDLWKIFRN